MGALKIDTMTGSGTVGDVGQGWSVTENATPVNPSDESAGTGSIELSALKNPSSKFVVDNRVTLLHSELGTLVGDVQETTESPTGLSFQVRTLLTLTTAERTAPPTGAQPLSEIFQSYIGLISWDISVDYQASEDPLRTYRGWQGSVWQHLKWLCAANKVELAMSGDTVIVRDVGSAVFDLIDARPNIQRSVVGTGRNVRVTHYNSELVSTLGATKFNLSTNPSVETNSADWQRSFILGAHTAGRSTAWASEGAASYRVNVTDPGSFSDPIFGEIWQEVDVTDVEVGEDVSVSIDVYAPIAKRCMLIITWLTDGGQYGVPMTSGMVNPSTPRTMTFSGPRPDAAVTAIRVELDFPQFYQYPTPNIEEAGPIYADALLVTNGALVPYFDGNSPGAVWTGPVNNSVSGVEAPPENDFYNAFQDDNTVYEVAVDETKSFTIQTTNYPTALSQPRAVDSLEILVGEYAVSGSDMLPVDADQWEFYGGSVSVEIGEVPGTIVLNLVGPGQEIPGVPGPYSLSRSDGENEYATLSIAGTGVVTDPQVITIATGASEDTTPQEFAPDVDIPFLNTAQEAYDVGAWSANAAAGPTATLTVSVPTDRLEGFGLTEGSLARHDDCIYRIKTVQIGRVTTSITAEWFVTMDEFDDNWFGADYAPTTLLVEWPAGSTTPTPPNPALGLDADSITWQGTLEIASGSFIAIQNVATTAEDAPNQNAYLEYGVATNAADVALLPAGLEFRAWKADAAAIQGIVVRGDGDDYASNILVHTFQISDNTNPQLMFAELHLSGSTRFRIYPFGPIPNATVRIGLAYFAGSVGIGSPSALGDFDDFWDGYSAGDIQIAPMRKGS